MQTKSLIAGALALGALTAYAQSGPPQQRGQQQMQMQGGGQQQGQQGMGMQHGPPPASVERAAIHKIMAEEMAKASGRKPAEIAKMLASSPPPEVARQLGLQPEAMKSAMQTAHATLIQKALAAGLIDQADVPAIQQEDARRAQQMQNGPPGMGGGQQQGMQGQNMQPPPQKQQGGNAAW